MWWSEHGSTCFSVDSETARYGVLVAIYASDGSVMVTHGGIDSGQGINTKVVVV